MYSKILGALIMLWGVGAFIAMIETIFTQNSNIARMLFICTIQFVIALIPIILGYKIFRKKEFSKNRYLLWIVIILSINIGVYIFYKDKITQKITFFRYNVQAINQKTRHKLVQATMEDDIEEVKLLISKGVDVNKLFGAGRTAIFFAHNLEILKTLLDAGANVNHVDNLGNTLVNAQSGSSHIQSYGATKLLLEYGLTPETINTQHNLSKYGALHGSDICFFCYDDTEEYENDYKNVELLIKSGADVNAVSKKGETPIFTVNDKCKRILINNGADIFTINNKNENILFYIEDYSFFKELVNNGLEYKIINKKSETLIHHTSNPKIIEHIVDEIDINHKNTEGRSALFFSYYTPNKLEVLLENEADVNLTNNKGETALHQYVRDCPSENGAYNKNLIKVIKLLLNTEIDINHKDNTGKTALDYARFGKLKDLLIAKGAQQSNQ